MYNLPVWLRALIITLLILLITVVVVFGGYVGGYVLSLLPMWVGFSIMVVALFGVTYFFVYLTLG